MRVTIAAAVIAIAVGACNQSQHTVTLRLWHFWSEPAQQKAFETLIAEFERAHPAIHVELTPLQWSEGKAKLQIAFSSGDPPDIVHLGSEWVAEFAPVLRRLSDSIASTVRTEFQAMGMVGTERVALPWTVNARVLFVHRKLGLPQNCSWNEFGARIRSWHKPPERYGIGLCVSDPHNVLKRTLPLLWACGGSLMASYPFSATCTAETVAALDTLVRMSAVAVVEPSRQLDARLRRGEVGAVLSGVWMLADSAVLKHYEVMPAIPSVPGGSGLSILSGDCFAIARTSKYAAAAEELLEYLSRWETAADFCWHIPDAGFPAQSAPSHAMLERLRGRAPQWSSAYHQTVRSRLLPSPPIFLDAERTVEETLTAVLYGRLSPQQAIHALEHQLRSLERAR